MTKATAVLVIVLATAFASRLPALGADGPPEWAYPMTPPDFKPAPDDGVPRRVPNSSATYTLTQLRARFIAYVPVGSVARGEALVKTGGAGKNLACVTCHGPDLKGVGLIPGIAGRSTNYAVRQLYDLKYGFGGSAFAVLTKDVVAKLDEEDMLAIAAYLATQAP